MLGVSMLKRIMVKRKNKKKKGRKKRRNPIFQWLTYIAFGNIM